MTPPNLGASAFALATLLLCTAANAQVSVDVDRAPTRAVAGDTIEIEWTVTSPEDVFSVVLYGDSPDALTELGRVVQGPAGTYRETRVVTTPGTLHWSIYVRSGQTRGRIASRTIEVVAPTAAPAVAIETLAGNGAGTRISGSTFPARGSLGGRSWGAAVNRAGETFVGLFDGGGIARLEGDGTASLVVDGLNLPMVFDFGVNDDLVIADHGNNRVLLATAAAGYADARTILGSNTVREPGAARFGRNGKIYVADTGNHRILEIEPDLSAARVVAGGVQGYAGDGSAARSAALNYPIDMDVDERGALVIADSINNRLRVVNLNTQGVLTVAGVRVAAGEIETLAGSGPVGARTVRSFSDSGARGGFSGDGAAALAAGIDWPFSPRFDNAGRIWFADADNHRIRRIDVDGTIMTLVGNAPLPQENGFRFIGSQGRDVGDGGPAAAGDLNRPMDLELVESNGGLSLLIGDTDNNRVRRVIGLTTVAQPPSPPTPPTPPAPQPDREAPQFAGVSTVAAAGTEGLSVRWSAAVDNETAAAGIVYRIYLATGGAQHDFASPTVETSPGARQATLSGLSSGTRYTVIVRAVDASGNEDGNTRVRSATTDAPPAQASFADVQAIFSQRCTVCHTAGGPAPFSLAVGSAFGNVVNRASQQVPSMPRVTPGDPARSYLLHKVEGTHQSVGGFGRQMPLGGSLTPAEVNTLRDWIEAGAPN